MGVERLEVLVRRSWPHPAVAIGNFDGVHRGHQALVQAVCEDAARQAGTAVVLTFDPHPSRVLAPDRAPLALMTLAQKAEVLQRLGIAEVAVLPFTFETSRLTPEAFARDVLMAALGARLVVVGRNFRFGRGRGGDAVALAGLGQQLGFRVHALEPVLDEGHPISSSRIREAVVRGAVDAAAHLLGRPFFIDGEVVVGDQRGRTLGFPTANLQVENEILPGGGVYAAWASAPPGRGRRPAVVNIGHRPTFAGQTVRVEAHLLDFAGDLYGQQLRLDFVVRLREERRFSGPQELVAQIRRDVEEGRRLLAGEPGEGPANAV